MRLNISGYFFLFLFLGFFASTNFFDHTHNIDGNVIAHSHPFKHDENGNPTHGHTTKEILFINILQDYIGIVPAILFVSLSLAVIINRLFPGNERNIISNVHDFSFLRRGPPATCLK